MRAWQAMMVLGWAPVVRRQAAVMSGNFVGRLGELRSLEAAWLAAGADGTAPVIVVHGESGIGKTRTVAEFARAVRARGAEVLRGTCHEGGDAHPYGAWAEALRGFAERSGGEALAAALGSEVRWLAPLLGDVPLPGVERVSAPPGVARVRLAEVLARVLNSFERPPVVVLDDMQWAYPESLELFGRVSPLAQGALVVVSCRGTGLELGHPLAQRLAEVHRRRRCEYLALESLPRREAGELLEQAAGGPLEAALVDAVYADSAGNPFFLEELGRHLQRRGATSLAARGGPGYPESIRGAVELRLAGVTAQARNMLGLASLFTAGFGFAELAALTQLTEAPLVDCLEQALSEELVRPLDGERYDFAHSLVREALYDGLSPGRRTSLHRRLAEALERLHQDDPARVAGELVRHYHASAALPGAGRGVIHARTAARAARSAGAPGDAVVMLRLGLDLVAAGDIETRAAVLGELARAEAEAGLADDAPRTLAAAALLLEREGAAGEMIAELLYEVVVTFTLAFTAVPPNLDAIEPLIARVLAALAQSRSLTWARLKLVDRYTRPEAAGPVRTLRPARLDPDAVQVVRSQGAEADYAFTIDSLDPAFGAEVEPLIDRIGGWRDPVARLWALVHVVTYLALTDPGGSPAAGRLSTELRALADDVGLLPRRGLARVLRAALLGGRGEFGAAAGQIEQARALFERQSPDGAIPGVVTLVEGLTSQHVAIDWPGLATMMWDLVRNPRAAGTLGLACAGFAAQAFAYAGEAERARAVLGYIIPELESAGPLEPANSGAVGLAAAAVWELRDRELAARLLPRALALADADGYEFYMTSTELSVARLSAVLGRFDQAADYFERARATLEQRGQRVMRAIVDYDEALARLASKRAGAARLLAVSSARFRELGMREWSRRAALLEVTGP
jgi:tetratricopeptide (TPR) repeat protein